MRSFPVIIRLDIFKDLTLCFISGFKPIPVDFFYFQRVQETLGNGIVPAIAFSAHARRDPVLFKQRLIIAAGILAAAVRVMDQACSRIPPTNGLF